jgi:RNA-directed DNA polymerase
LRRDGDGGGGSVAPGATAYGASVVSGRFYPSVLYRLLARINAYLVRWIRNKYRRYDATRTARRKFAEITSGYPRMFRHWRWVTTAY